ncbi:MAG: (d)CMP kinase [Armatimonadota bacterium]
MAPTETLIVMQHLPIVAIDGPAGSGKSTVARLAAAESGLPFVSSGAMYRAVALQALREGVGATDRRRMIEIAEDLPIQYLTLPDGDVRVLLAEEDVTEALQSPGVGQIASALAIIPELREPLVAKQRDYGREGGVIMEGRDIQTVVFPDADIKIFLTASAEERAQRRWKELQDRGEPVDRARVLDEVRERDARDAERAISPLRAADDAIIVDTDGRAVSDVVACIVRVIRAWQRQPDLHGQDLARAAGCAEGTR